MAIRELTETVYPGTWNGTEGVPYRGLGCQFLEVTSQHPLSHAPTHPHRIDLRPVLAGPCCAALAHSLSTVEGEALVHRDKVELTIKVRPEDILLSAGMTLIIADRIEEAVIVKARKRTRSSCSTA